MHKKTYKVTVVLKKDLTVLVVVVVVVDKTSGSSKKLLVSNYSRTSTYGHLSIMATYLCPGGQYIQCFIFKPLDDGHLSKMAMAQQPFFSATDGKVKNGHEISFPWRFDY